MADILTFDPASEFEILETIEDFQEEVQRPEELRFFTLDEQVQDYLSKVVAGKKKVTRFEIKKVYNQVDRFKEIYNQLIVESDTESGYSVDFERKSVNVDWITPIYSKFEYVAYPYKENWQPLMGSLQANNPNYYNRMLTALPKPYKTVEKEGRLITKKEVLSNEEGKNLVQALTNYSRTRGIVHEDGTFSVVPLEIANTGDDVYIKGYYLGNRKVDIPNPLKNHPFLSSVEPSSLITNDSLLDIFPSIQAIMNHAVKTTTDPYGEGMTFLKVYDVKLKQIPWKLWKERFPPVDQVSASPKVISVKFPEGDDIIAPSDNIKKQYINPWNEGVFPRFWLTQQEDGGTLIAKMFLSKVGKDGLVPPEVVGDKLTPKFNESTPEECFNADSFDSLLSSGLYRQAPISQTSQAVDKNKPLPKGTCVTVDYIHSEISSGISSGKTAWRETSGKELLEQYTKLLRKFQLEPNKEVVPKYEKYASNPESELRKDVLTILADPHRDPEDKADDIQTIVNMIMPVNNVYLDKDESKIVCNHTLALLRGDLEEDNLEFYLKWATIEDGSRLCKFCGEEINTDVFVAQDEFTVDGKLVINYGKLDEDNQILPESNISVFSKSLREIGKLFNLENAGEATMYLLLSILQILPNESILLPILQNIRKLAAVLRSNKKIEKSRRETAEGISGIAGMVILLQTHNPFLIPRRLINRKPFKTSGYPRDTSDPEDSPVLDSILYVLRATFEEFPNTFAGPTASLFRTIISNTKRVREETIRFLGQALIEFKTQFESAKERYVEPIQDETFSSELSLPLIKLDKLQYSPNEKIGNEELMMKCGISKPHTIFTTKMLPKVSHDPVELLKNTLPSKEATYVTVTKLEFKKISFDDKEIRRRLNIKLTKITKSDKIEKFLNRENIDAVSVITLMNRILDILSKQDFDIKLIASYRDTVTYLETRKNPSLLRDTVKGLLFELFQEISRDSNKVNIGKAIDEALLKDVVMNMILLTKEDAQEIADSVRTKEREKFKQKMRTLNDTQREITKMLLDIGVAPYIITNEDREIFSREYNYPDPEEEYNRLIAQSDQNAPEDGYNNNRDYEDGDIPLNAYGNPIEVDHGAYGDRAVRPYDDYSNMVGDFESIE